MAMTVAIPRFNDLVAPRFEVARYFVIARIDAAGKIERETVQCSGCVGLGRVQLLIDQRVDALICGGIRRVYRDLLSSRGIDVIDHAVGTVDTALDAYLRNDLQKEEESVSCLDQGPRIPLEDLICWTKELFTEHGYAVHDAADRALFPVDLVAEIKCPVCNKPLRIAICCGAHAYRCDQEIQQLHQVAGPDFHARVYVHPTTAQAQRCCLDYDIELLDPNRRFTACERPGSHRLPILQNAIPGHERAFARAPER